jgi:phospholipase C
MNISARLPGLRMTVLLAALLAGVAALTAPSVTQARAAPAGQAVANPIRHVVVLYMENHSFDNVLGFWCDQHRARCPDGGMPSSVTLSNGVKVKPHVDPDVVPTVEHNVKTQLTAIDHGKMDGWENIPGGSCSKAKGYRCISGYKPAQVPNLIALAAHFAMSDRTFSMGDSPSWGGHLYAAMASLDGFTGNNPVPSPGTTDKSWGCNHTTITSWVSPDGKTHWVPSCVPDPKLKVPNGGAFEPTPVPWAPTIFDRLDAAKRVWHIYDGANGFSHNGWSICPSFADCWYTGQRRNGAGTKQFANAAAQGKLPAFSVITPGGKNTQYSQHNGFSMTAGDNFIGRIAHDVMTSPEWKSTVLFISYDDCGCFYDQVPPKLNPDGTQQGPRSPLIIVSPYARPSFTDTVPATFVGILAYVEHTFGIAPLGVNDRKAYPFTKAFNYAQRPLAPIPMVTRPVPRSDHIHWAQAREDT